MILARFAIIFTLLIALLSSNLSFIKQTFLSSVKFQDEISKLELERDSLKAQLFINENLSGKEIQENNWEYIYTKIFSSYPFNNQSLVGINIGTANGINIGQAVALAPGILFGKIIKTNSNSSLVETIFDNDFTAAVKIGENKVNALLKGGLPPTLEMIEKNKDIKNGDMVYSADTNFPYGFKIGEVQIINNKDTAEPFKKAFLKVGYSVNSLEEVLVIKNFESLKK